MHVLELQVVDIRTFFSGMLTDLKRLGKQFQQPADSVTRTRGWIWRHHYSVWERTSLNQTKHTSSHKLWKRSTVMPDSESDDEHSEPTSTNTSFRRQAIPPLVMELTSSWQQTMSAMTSESSDDDMLSTVEVIVLLLTVIKHIVYEDIKSAKEMSPCTVLVPNIANVLRDIICQLRSTDCRTVKALSEVDLIIIGRCLVRVFFLILLQTGEQNSGLTWLHHCKSIAELIDCVSESVSVLSHDVNRRLLVMDCVLGCWMYAEGLLLRHHGNTIVIGTVCRTTELITRHRGTDLTQRVLLRMSEGSSRQELSDSLNCVQLLKRVVAVGRLLKLMRSRYVHCCTCPRRTHRHCDVTGQHSVYRHHHDSLGVALDSVSTSTTSNWSSLYSTLTNNCIVSCLAIFLLGLFRQSADTHVRMYLLDIFDKGVVTCCCLPVDLLVTTFVGDQSSQSGCQLQKKSVTVLVNILLNDCGGNATLDHCTVCGDVLQLTRVRSVINSCDSDSSAVCRWKCISQLAEMLCSDDSTLTVHVISQAARLASSGNESLKQQLYCGFCMPLLVTVVHQLFSCSYSDSSMLTILLSADDTPLAVKMTLSALSMVLTNTAVLHQFVSSRGIEMICRLADMNTTRHCALSLLEVLVNVENADAERECAEMAGSSQFSDSVTNVEALDAFVQLLFSDCNDRPWNDGLCIYLQSSDCQVGQMLDLWHVACQLFPHNGLFRERFVKSNGPKLAYVLLVAASEAFLAVDCGPIGTDIHVAVFCAQDEQCHGRERSLLLLVRSVLSTCLRCSDLDVGIPQQVNTFFTVPFFYHFTMTASCG